MQKRTYARTAGSGATTNSQEGDSIKQSPFSGLSMDRTNPPPTSFMNAPTSLTNLAQLSGISLLPINDRQSALNMSVRNSHIISINGHQQPRITVSASNRQHSGLTTQHELTSPNTYPQYHTSSYNVGTVPSIQLLNRTPVVQQPSTGVLANVPRPSTTKSKRQAAPSNSTNSGLLSGNKRPKSNAYPDAATLSGYPNDMVQVLPVSESIGLNFIPRSARGLQSTEDGAFQSGGPYSPMNSGNDSMSLVKLMAIFNNPALTITPVVTGSTSVPSSNTNSSWMNLNQNTNQSQMKMHTSRQTPIKSSHRSMGEITQSNQTSKKISDQKNLPKSATNLIYAGSAISPMDTQEYESVDTQVQSLNRDPNFEQPDTITLTWSGREASPGDTNGFPQKESVCQSPAPIIHPGISRELVPMTETIECSPSTHDIGSPDSKQDFIISHHKIDPKPLANLAKCKDIIYSVSSKPCIKKLGKTRLVSTKRRLYVPRVESMSSKKAKSNSWLNDVKIESIERLEDSYISERHMILGRLDEIAESICQKRTVSIEPDDIFVDKSKRVMSRIDTHMERKRKKNFEKISQKSPLEDQSEDSSDDYDYEIQFARETNYINELTVLPIQLPLEETLDENKRNYMSSIGLISRIDKNKILATQSERRIKAISMTDVSQNYTDADTDEDVQRIVNTLLQTGGGEICMRTESDIKRNELPFVEGLNRNTSRIKINFMNGLGLEKRSKRTTLYKVVKSQEAANNQTQSDLSNKVVENFTSNNIMRQQVSANVVPRSEPPVSSKPRATPAEAVKRDLVESMSTTGGSVEILRKAIKLAQASCREALHRVPNKDEYMKSLGLMAS